MATKIDGTKTEEAADKPLDKEYIKVLNKVKDALATDMDPDQILVKMAASNAFSSKDEEVIKGNENKGRWERSVTMLEILNLALQIL